MALPNFHNIDYKNIVIGDYEIVGIPYFDRSQDFDIILQNLTLLKRQTKYKVLLCHQTPHGIFNQFIPSTFDIHDDRLKDFDFVFSGHIHRYQEFGKNRYMVGNPIVQDASDCGDNKGYLYLKDGIVERVVLDSILDGLVVEHLDTRKKAVAKVDKTVNVDHRFYSDDRSDVFTAFCEAVKLEQPTINVGKKIMFG
jgi:DNA repair exonuclease SbcCD nuclease subunit